ncbi:MAG: hypothetical protein KBT29_07900, partial [Prevotellaceae bacterium]|nr:hypothetical protein [Candidatus Minthosoma caballi]
VISCKGSAFISNNQIEHIYYKNNYEHLLKQNIRLLNDSLANQPISPYKRKLVVWLRNSLVIHFL